MRQIPPRKQLSPIHVSNAPSRARGTRIAASSCGPTTRGGGQRRTIMKTTSLSVWARSAGLLIAASLVSTAAAQRAPIATHLVLWTDFEAPAYLAGPLVKQDNWAVDPAVTNPMVATVDSKLTGDGSQSVRISAEKLGCVSATWFRPLNYQVTTMTPLVDLDWDFYVSSTKPFTYEWVTTVNANKGPLVSLIVNSGASDSVLYAFGGGDPILTSARVERDHWNHLEIKLDYLRGTASIWVNGFNVNPWGDGASAIVLGSTLDRISFSATGPGRDTGGFDNMRIAANPMICYANCDGTLDPPLLTVNDFVCFMNSYVEASGMPSRVQISSYANCDRSVDEPVLNVADFVCFMNSFAAGCGPK
jgi:hypothetical protein